jgi:hypothetical protein
MTTKSQFNAEEWEQVTQAPAFAAVMVAFADRGGTFRESLAVGRAYTEARQGSGSELLGEIVSSPPRLDRKSMGSPDQLRQELPQRLSAAVRLVEQKATPEEAREYRDFILRVADVVAHAHKEGGVLGIGGKDVSQEEQAVLDQLAGTLTPSS